MAQHDYDISNQTFPSFRSDLNSVLEAINTSNSGTSRPSSAVAGTIWLDTTNATNPTLKLYDGADDISLATFDYSANTVNWIDSTVVFDIVNDTTPQLGGNLDVNGNSLVSTSNGNITFTPDGTGKVVISGLNYPTSDGTADQVLTTDGSGNLSFSDISGGTSWQSSIKTTNFTAVAGEGYWINTTSGSLTITLPSSANVGDTIEFVDYARTWATNKIIIDSNGLNYQGDPDTSDVEYDTNGQGLRIVYSGATQGWIPTSDDDVEDNPVVPTYSVDFLVIAGGGYGKVGSPGGGGAGGYRNSYSSETSGRNSSSESSLTFTLGTTYTITVGAGGTSGNGSNSSISGTGITTITSQGGGFGAQSGASGANGGCGGGGGETASAGGSGTANQGFDGGYGNGGGGGASGNGYNGYGQGVGLPNGGLGGTGLASSITGSSITRASGGSAYYAAPAPTRSANVTGGGGGASNIHGVANTGGGGAADGGNGGSGIVILRMPTADYSGTTTGSPIVTTSGSDTILTFTGSGSYTG